jgi:transcriptional regulator
MKRNCYELFGMCYNNGDFSPLSSMMHKDCIYQSYDFLYILKGKDNVLKSLEQRAKENIDANDDTRLEIYKGFYQKKRLTINSIKDCCILAKKSDRQDVRIIYINKKWGKISHIIVIDPNKVKHKKAQKFVIKE